MTGNPTCASLQLADIRHTKALEPAEPAEIHDGGEQETRTNVQDVPVDGTLFKWSRELHEEVATECFF